MALLILSITWGIFTTLVGAVMYASQVGPDEAISKLSLWANKFGVEDPPAWLKAKSADRKVRNYSALALGLLLVFGGFLGGMALHDHLSPNVPPAMTASPRWQPLSDDEQRIMRNNLRSLPAQEMNVMCSVPTCYDLAESLKTTFDDLQWKGGLHTSYWSDGVSTGIELWSSNDSAVPVARAIESASNGRLKVTVKENPLPVSEGGQNNLVIGRLPK